VKIWSEATAPATRRRSSADSRPAKPIGDGRWVLATHYETPSVVSARESSRRSRAPAGCACELYAFRLLVTLSNFVYRIPCTPRKNASVPVGGFLGSSAFARGCNLPGKSMSEHELCPDPSSPHLLNQPKLILPCLHRVPPGRCCCYRDSGVRSPPGRASVPNRVPSCAATRGGAYYRP
jgi:hypothetical protein